MANAVAKRYPGEEHFVDGYVPQSMNAEYSSLHRSITWIGMGLVLASLAAWGTFIFGLATTIYSDTSNAAHSHGVIANGEMDYTNFTNQWTNFDGSLFMWAGLILAIVMTVAGFTCISIGRRAYKAYKKEFGGHH
nr:hypothetical protein [Corynebacterium lactis]